MDTGPIIAQREYPISPEDTAETLTANLFQAGATLLIDHLDRWVCGELSAQPQDESRATITRKLARTDGLADWKLSAAQLERNRRAYTPWPGLYTYWRGQVLKLLDTVALPNSVSMESRPGQVVSLGSGPASVGITTADDVLGLKRVQLEGRRPATAEDFLRGYPQFIGSQL
jgi:methionyl-tRNA formyltransferase